MLFDNPQNGKPSSLRDTIYDKYSAHLYDNYPWGVNFFLDVGVYSSEKSLRRQMLYPIYYLLATESPNVYTHIRYSVANISSSDKDMIQDYNDLTLHTASRDRAVNVGSSDDITDTILINLVEIRSGKSFVNSVVTTVKDEIERCIGLEALLTLTSNTMVRAFYKKDDHNTLTIMTSDNTIETIRRILGALPLLFPQYKLKDTAREALKLFGGTEYGDYAAAYTKWVGEEGVIEGKIRKKYFKALKCINEGRVNRLKDNRNRGLNSYRSLEQQMAGLLVELEEINMQITALELASDEANQNITELVEYAMQSGKIKNIQDSGYSSVLITFATDLLYWDVELAERLIEREVFGDSKSKAFYRMFKAIFVDRRFTIELRHNILWHVQERRLEADISQDATVAYNPHLYHYNCFGNNSNEFRKCCENGQYITGFELLSAAVASINLQDSAVRNKLADDMTGNWRTRRTIRDEKGVHYNFVDLMNLMNKEIKEEAEAAELARTNALEAERIAQEEADRIEQEEIVRAQEERLRAVLRLKEEENINEVYNTTTNE